MKNCVEFSWALDLELGMSHFSSADHVAGLIADLIGKEIGEQNRHGKFSGCAGRLIGTSPNEVVVCVMTDDPKPDTNGTLVSVWCQEPTPHRVGIFRRKVIPDVNDQTFSSVVSSLKSYLDDDADISNFVWMSEMKMFADPQNNNYG
jgi:hypothetical protein